MNPLLRSALVVVVALIGCDQPAELTKPDAPMLLLPEAETAEEGAMEGQLPPPPPQAGHFDLSMSALVHGEYVSLVATGAPPGDLVVFAYSRGGLGPSPCPPYLYGACPSLRAPVRSLFTSYADADGIARLDALVPSTLPETCVAFQAFSPMTPERSIPVQRCISATAETCHEDVFLGHHDLATAIEVPSDVPWLDLQSCPDAADVFAVELEEDEVLHVEAQFNHALGDIDLELLHESTPGGGAQILTRSYSASDDEEMYLRAPRTGTYYVRANLFDGHLHPAGNTYDLWMDVLPPTQPCIDDGAPLEPNDSRALSPIVAAPYNLFATSCPNNHDYVSINVSAGAILDAQLTFDGTLGDIDLVLENSSGIIASSAGSGDSERIVYQVPTTGRYYLRVTLFEALDDYLQWGNDYNLSVVVR